MCTSLLLILFFCCVQIIKKTSKTRDGIFPVFTSWSFIMLRIDQLFTYLLHTFFQIFYFFFLLLISLRESFVLHFGYLDVFICLLFYQFHSLKNTTNSFFTVFFLLLFFFFFPKISIYLSIYLWSTRKGKNFLEFFYFSSLHSVNEKEISYFFFLTS